MYKLVKTCSLCLVKSPVTKRLPHRFLCSETSNTEDLLQSYDPKEVEKQYFTNEKYFEPPLRPNEQYSLILPPPNVTGTLHLGHALTATIEDVLVRWKRMQGVETLWVPGIDHAGIATQVLVEKSLLKEEGKTRHEVGREKFKERVWWWKEEKTPVIRQQLRRLGTSLNWDRESFTMDQRHSKAVQAAFVKLFESGLIYRSDYLVNWSCDLRSAISDIEVEHLEVDGPTWIQVPGYDKPVKFGVLYKFAYKVKDSDEEIIVATTRPETVLGDVAVAVHPLDSRFQKFIGRSLWHPFRKETIPVIADDFVDPQFGTGAVKVTPGHDRADFAAGRRHSLGALQVIDETGRLSLSSPFQEFRGMRRFDARGRIVDALAGMGLMRGEEGHRNVVPICSRSKDVVELMVRPQWFVKCDGMAKRALDAVRNGELSIHPLDFEKQWFTWLENIRDWCISRQLWWGHQIPAYLCKAHGEEVWVAAEDETIAREKAAKKLGVSANSITITRDEDVLDTWFSSGLQAFAVFGWPEKTTDLEKYYPLSLMETGHDILFFWVARMVMLGVELTGKLPFEKVLLHGIICDSHGRKMSKSLGNVVAPEDVINGATLPNLGEGLQASFAAGVLSKDELKRAISGQKKMFPEGIPECGSDALRFTLVSHNIKSRFINFDVKECHTNRLFCNKIWQATRFVKMNLGEKLKEICFDDLGLMDKWILSRLTRTVNVVNASLESCDFHLATLALKNFLYYDYCDVYLESTKPGLRNTNSIEAAGSRWTLVTCLDLGLRTLAPFMPMLAQHLHQRLPIESKMFDFPKDLPWLNTSLETDAKKTMEIVVSIRRLKKTFHITNKQKPNIHLVGPSAFLQRFSDVIHNLGSCQAMENPSNLTDCVKDVVGDVSVFLPVSDEQRKALQLDLDKMTERKDKLLKELEKLRIKIRAESYQENTKVETKEGHLKKIASIEDKLSRIDYIRNLVRN